ncbi:class I SAM-dependent methyltransferase [Roseiconus lacunae]|uniref:Class I SAM-dependent methyltransferase n=1 Tax=Roseiconus lacunae TaxID=2605694 RepID=A0ABT7PJU7_9BACT|nr:class I SAM-dependent methyltransferase [Roseiconus lacunae]MDM4016754.1 class I SAM-dependent methyltransferase [Roseiconus lacunae]
MPRNLPDSESNHYQLLDFGDGRKLERFGMRVLDRPSPAAEGSRRADRSLWRDADSVFDKSAKRWHHRRAWDAAFRLDCDGFVMPISPTPFGHVGVFPEQSPNWAWLRQNSLSSIDAARTPGSDSNSDPYPQGLNLFAYTGASTIAMAVSGLAVAHVDAAKPNVASAKIAAEANQLNNHPIRYLVDDAAKFVAREVRRGRRYQTIVMDPPAYGHSPRGKTWRLERDLWPLLDHSIELLDRSAFRLLITGHSPQVDAGDVVDYLRSNLPSQVGVGRGKLARAIQFDRLTIATPGGRRLDFGFFVRLAIDQDR